MKKKVLSFLCLLILIYSLPLGTGEFSSVMFKQEMTDKPLVDEYLTLELSKNIIITNTSSTHIIYAKLGLNDSSSVPGGSVEVAAIGFSQNALDFHPLTKVNESFFRISLDIWTWYSVDPGNYSIDFIGKAPGFTSIKQKLGINRTSESNLSPEITVLQPKITELQNRMAINLEFFASDDIMIRDAFVITNDEFRENIGSPVSLEWGSNDSMSPLYMNKTYLYYNASYLDININDLELTNDELYQSTVIIQVIDSDGHKINSSKLIFYLDGANPNVELITPDLSSIYSSKDLTLDLKLSTRRGSFDYLQIWLDGDSLIKKCELIPNNAILSFDFNIGDRYFPFNRELKIEIEVRNTYGLVSLFDYQLTLKGTDEGNPFTSQDSYLSSSISNNNNGFNFPNIDFASLLVYTLILSPVIYVAISYTRRKIKI